MEDAKHQCAVCERELLEGTYAISLESGIIGTDGFKPLEERLLFCNEECVAKHCKDVSTPRYKLRRRIP